MTKKIVSIPDKINELNMVQEGILDKPRAYGLKQIAKSQIPIKLHDIEFYKKNKHPNGREIIRLYQEMIKIYKFVLSDKFEASKQKELRAKLSSLSDKILELEIGEV